MDAMDHLELAGAPLAWLWLFIISSIVVLLPLLRGLMRRGSGIRHERRPMTPPIVGWMTGNSLWSNMADTLDTSKPLIFLLTRA